MARSNNTAKKQAVDKIRQAYTRWMEGSHTEDDVKTVVEDLKKFCRADISTFHPDQRVHALIEGRREVWLRIHQFSTLTTDQIIEARNLEKHRNA